MVVAEATFFFNMSRNIVALQVETLLHVLPRLWPTLLAAKYSVASLWNSTRIIGQLCVNKDGSFFHII